jgi:putative endonuclease
MRQYHVYIMANRSRTLYTGVTNDLARRVHQHKHKLVAGFTSKYGLTRLVYAESTDDVRAAITREKQIKGWLRAKKIALVESLNPDWDDLGEIWFGNGQDPSLRSAAVKKWGSRASRQAVVRCTMEQHGCSEGVHDE